MLLWPPGLAAGTEGFSPPAGRSKPWGTGHAVYCCRGLIRGPFAVINADDFYGADAFAKVSGFLQKAAEDNEKYHLCMAGYYIENTLTDYGHVARGVCAMSDGGYLGGITEFTRIERKNGEIVYTDSSASTAIAPGTIVSMNLWGFTPSIMREFEPSLKSFLSYRCGSLESAEFFLPSVVNELIEDGKADVMVLETGAKWYGVTYREDKKAVQKAVRNMIKTGKYPERLWNDET